MPKFHLPFFLALALTSCGKHEAPPPQAMPPSPVTVAPPTQQKVQEWDEFTGRTDATETVEIRPRVSGYLDSVSFQSGQMVKKSEVLFTIDARPFQAVLDRVKAEVQRAKTGVELSKKEAERADKLTATNAISNEEAEAKRSGFRAANDALQAAEAAVRASELDVEFCTVRSPLNGRVSRAMVTAGNYVSGVAGFTTLLTTVVTVDPVYVYADVDESTFLRYQRLSASGKGTHLTNKETPAELQLEGEDGYPHKGKIESFDNRISATTGSIIVRAVFDNKDGSLRPGLFVRMRLPAGPEYEALLVSEKAIGTDQGRKYLWAVDAKNMPEYRAIETGPLVGEKRVIRSGVTAKDSIVVNGTQRVIPGMPLAPTAEKAAPAAP